MGNTIYDLNTTAGRWAFRLHVRRLARQEARKLVSDLYPPPAELTAIAIEEWLERGTGMNTSIFVDSVWMHQTATVLDNSVVDEPQLFEAEQEFRRHFTASLYRALRTILRARRQGRDVRAQQGGSAAVTQVHDEEDTDDATGR